MSEEVKKVQTRVPRSIIAAAISNSTMLFAFVLVILYCIGDLTEVQGDVTGLPLIQVYFLATKSHAATTIMVALPAIVLFICLFNAFASVSRLAWAFSRDKGLPFSNVFAYVSLSMYRKADWRMHLTHDSGLSRARVTAERAGIDRGRLVLTIYHLRHLRHRFQRDHLTPSYGTERVVYPTYHLHPHS